MKLAVIQWLENHSIPCFYKKYFGIECPGCGVQRSFILLLKGDAVGSFMMYPALLPTVGVTLLLCVHLFFKFKKGGSYIMCGYVFVSAIIMISYILKLIGLFHS